MDTVAVVAGNPITVGMVASFLTQLVKGRSWFPKDTLAIRVVVALACVLISGTATWVQGMPVDFETLVNATLSYLTASAAFVHLFQD